MCFIFQDKQNRRPCEMTAILPTTTFHVAFGMEEQCLDDSFFTDGWENSSDDFTFLCGNLVEQGK